MIRYSLSFVAIKCTSFVVFIRNASRSMGTFEKRSIYFIRTYPIERIKVIYLLYLLLAYSALHLMSHPILYKLKKHFVNESLGESEGMTIIS